MYKFLKKESASNHISVFDICRKKKQGIRIAVPIHRYKIVNAIYNEFIKTNTVFFGCKGKFEANL